MLNFTDSPSTVCYNDILLYEIICFEIYFLFHSEDPLISLNYAVFLYNMGDRPAAARQFAIFEQCQVKTDSDQEVRKCIVAKPQFSYV